MTLCPICHSSQVTTFASLYTPYGDRKERYQVYVCNDCGHGFARGRLDPDFLAGIYSDGFHQTSQQEASNKSLPIYVNARARVAWLMSKGLSGRLVDIGCGNGAFVEVASGHFSASGVELSSSAVRFAKTKGLDVIEGDLVGIDFGAAKFDVITLWDVLAGFPDLSSVMTKCVSLLKPSGVLVASLPMIGSVAARVLRSRWPLLIPPVNIHFFDRRSIRAMAAQYGLNVIEIRPMAKKVALNFLLTKAMRSLKMFGLAGLAAKIAPAWPVSVNTRDIAYVVFQRPA
jgi:2-polyprenyl-3-methyl-5-hydroxy-6-metoxy-1,4-benzoquinol methylase